LPIFSIAAGATRILKNEFVNQSVQLEDKGAHSRTPSCKVSATGKFPLAETTVPSLARPNRQKFQQSR
jgi:hypothetical protein